MNPIYQIIISNNRHQYDAASFNDALYIKQDDPLKKEQLAKIRTFLDACLLSQEKKSIKDYGRIFERYEHRFENCQEHLPKLYKPHLKERDKAIEILIGTRKDIKEAKEEAELFLNAINDPTLLAKELSLDIHDRTQVYAAKVLIKAALKSPPWRYDGGFDEVYERYRKKLFHQGKIKPKHFLLIQNDPVYKQTPKTPLQILMSKTYFCNLKNVLEQRRRWPGGRVEESKTIYEIEREEIRQETINFFERMNKNSYLHPVLTALAVIFKKEKGGIFFSNSCMSTSIFAAAKGHGGGILTRHCDLISL